MLASIKSFLYNKYYSLSSTKSLQHSSNSINNNCQRLAVEREVTQKISENKVTNSILKK